MSDATSAYRGYRLQLLYTLYRVLQANDDGIVFQPEGVEDLAVFDGNGLIEVVQIKARHDLSLADLVSRHHTASSFFHRVNELIQQDSTPRIRLIHFYPLGPQLDQALTGRETARLEVERKLIEQYSFSSEQAGAIVASIEPERAEEEKLTGGIFDFLRETVVGVDPESAFDLLSHWLYGCAERQSRITRQDVIDRINGVGRFLSQRHAYHSVWFTSVIPLEEQELDDEVRDVLAGEFYRGVGARYEHILSDLDVPRPAKLAEISAAFEERNAVVIHGASGQGKTTLALRYLRGIQRESWPYMVLAVADRIHAHQISTALEGYADALGVPIAVFVDVSPKDDGWPDLIERLARHPRIRLVVTVREEDWRRAVIFDSDALRDVDLEFDETEAEQIYGFLSAHQSPTDLLDFEDAWLRFGGEGPLLEFVYLVTQGASLRERLTQQVSRLKHEANCGHRSSKDLELLRLTAIASSFGARVRVKALADHLAVLALDYSIRQLEDEYLIRRAENGTLLDGLHPIRSRTLVSLLIDPVIEPWSRSACSLLRLLDEQDLGSFLLHCFSRHLADAEPLLEELNIVQPESWIGVVGVLRSLIWLGLREYAETNRALIDDARRDSGPGWWVVLDADIANARPGVAASTWDTLGDIVTPERRQQIDALRERQTPKEDAFVRVRHWLRGLTHPPRPPSSVEEWQAAAESVFWAGRLGYEWPLAEWLPTNAVNEAVHQLPLDPAADLVVGLYEGYGQSFSAWLEANRSALRERFQRETGTPVLEDDGRRTTAHFIVDPDLDSLADTTRLDSWPRLDASNHLHNEALIRVDLMRRLFPDREFYACQGYGHGIKTVQFLTDDTKKTGVDRAGLPLRWLTRSNSTFGGLVTYNLRPYDWREYAQQVMGLREQVISCMEDLRRALPIYLGTSKPISLLGRYVPAEEWYLRWRDLREPPLLPKCAVDEWGFVHESLAESASGGSKVAEPTELSRIASLRRYRPLLVSFREYTQAFHNFLLQAPTVMTANTVVQKSRRYGQANTRTNDSSPKREDADRRLSAHNLADAWKALPEFQRQYRQLLSRFADQTLLDEVERQEADLFATVWPMWRAFTAQPNVVLDRPIHEAANRLVKTIRRLHRALERELRSISRDAIQARVLSKDVHWVSDPVIWIAIDAIDGVAVYNALVPVLEALCRAVRSVEDTDLRRYALDFYWRYVIVVPLVRGRSLSGMAWRMHTDILVSSDHVESLGLWHFVQYPIPSSALADIGVSVWTDPRLTLGAQLSEAASQLWLLVVHIADLADLPDLEGVGEEIGLQHVEDMIARVNESAQPVIDRADELARAMSDFGIESEFDAEVLSLAIDALKRLISAVLPTDDHEDVSTLQVRDFGPWAVRVGEGLGYAQIAQAAWASAVLSRAETR